jgi:AraC-like DNA-binding protein
MLFLSRKPAPPLDAFVEMIWFCENDPRPCALERVLPHGYAQLIVNLKEDRTRQYFLDPSIRCETTSGTILGGLGTAYTIIDTAEQECVAGVVFKPGGTRAFFRTPAHEIAGNDVSLDLLIGSHSLRERCLEALTPPDKIAALEGALREMMIPAAIPPAVDFAISAMANGGASVGDVVSCIGLSAKRFIEQFKASVGMTPKQYCRILRFQRTLSLFEKGRFVNWTSIAADCDYFDQAHFIHDFRSFAGISPTEYQANRSAFRNHVKFLQSPDPAS